IIQQYTHVARAGNNLCPPFYLDGGKAGLYRLVGDAEIPRGSDGAERVVNRKQAGQRQEQLVSLAPLAAGENGGKTVCRYGKLRIFRAVVSFFGHSESQPPEAI